jgi:hypothetical protein
LPEVVPAQAHLELATSDGLQTIQPNDGLQVSEYYQPPKEDEKWASATSKPVGPPAKKTLFGWSRRKLWIVIVVATLVVVAIVVGATVGALMAGGNR